MYQGLSQILGNSKTQKILEPLGTLNFLSPSVTAIVSNLNETCNISDVKKEHVFEMRLTWIILKFTAQLFPALEGMNLSPYLSFCGEFTGVICFRGIRG